MSKRKRSHVFSITLREQTRKRIDEMANEENRSRSALIDIACDFYYNHKKKEKSDFDFLEIAPYQKEKREMNFGKEKNDNAGV